jgi:prolipoprotein diacylglyceryltransferase
MMAGILAWMLWKGISRTHQLQLYLIAYGIFRFTTEWIRPEPAWALGLTFYQWVCLAMIAGLTLQWMWESRRSNAVVWVVR